MNLEPGGLQGDGFPRVIFLPAPPAIPPAPEMGAAPLPPPPMPPPPPPQQPAEVVALSDDDPEPVAVKESPMPPRANYGTINRRDGC